MKLVEAAQVVKQSLQRLLNRRQLKKPVNHNIEHRDKPQTHISKVHWQGLEIVAFLCQDIRGKLLWKLVMNFKVFLMPVVQ